VPKPVIRNTIKPSPMPESIHNRCTKSHEYIFLLVKKLGYFYDAEAIKEKSKGDWNSHGAFCTPGGKNESMSIAHPDLARTRGRGTFHPDVVQSSSNKRSVWTVSSQGYEGAHFATFPKKLIEPCILAGTSEKGCCANCGAPWKRVVESRQLKRDRPNDYVKYADTSHEKKQNTPGKSPQGGWDAFRALDKSNRKKGVNSCANSVAGVDTKTVGWEPTCDCGAGVIPCTVLDPFVGSGTTCCVSLDHGRRSIGIDLSEKYLHHNAVVRIEGELLIRPALASLTGRTPKRIS